MTKFCPTCGDEFNDTISICPTHHQALTKNPPLTNTTAIACDIYATANEIEAERIVAFLADAAIETGKRENSIAQLPLASDNTHIISVPTEKKTEAVELIQSARIDGVISDLGTFLSTP